MWADAGYGDEGHYKEKWQRITVGGAECGNLGSDMCVNGASRVEGGGRMVCIRTVSCRHVFFIFLWERNGWGL